ncbi:PREDICTED: ATP-dependent DNA helicase PIF1-like [Ipomoea nil]|uniref:ATP-dependent DNA helicase PIF1-like n=1 Tax=Ipomoea nil TaxID=35883 RepID=UPI00090182D9|nr:PREDICTED: ATP-dependent DNA helicase PIF1-like [Ipomoea nil]
MRDLLRFVDPNSEMKTFGGKTVVLGGDFRQILPVVPKGTRQDIVSSAINSSYLWDSCKVLRLTKNLKTSSVHNGAGRHYKSLLTGLPISAMESWVGGMTDSQRLKYLITCRAILAPTLDVVNAVNEYMTELHNAESRSYYSSDAVCKADGDNGILGDVHTPEFLNSIRVSALPNHTLNLKTGSPVMLMRKIDHSLGLCNGTRLIITKLADHVIEGELLISPNKGTKVLIPRMSMSPSDPRLPFKFQRRQFPLMLSYAMTINKSQGQTLTHVGLILKKPVFVHGQLYVAASRVNNQDGLKILIVKDSSSTTTSTTNVVYHEVFNNL